MALLPSHQADPRRARKYQRRASKWKTRTGALVIFACCFLGILGWRRASRLPSLDASGARPDFHRTLKEQLNGMGGGNGGVVSLSTDHTAHPEGLTAFPATGLARRVLLCTHSRLAWYYYETQQFKIIHEGQGVYYGGFAGDRLARDGTPTTVWVISRPHNWRPTTAKEFLLEINTTSGEVLTRVSVPSRFTHDTVRFGNRVFAADTGEGHILELEFPSMKLLRRMELFTLKEHVNTLSPTVNGTLWAMLHNLGPSIMAEIDLETGRELRRFSNVGLKSHGAVQWRDSFIALDSDNAALMRVDPVTGQTTRLWAAADENRYLKALCVVDDIAFFGVAEAQQRQSRDSTDLNCDLAAFDLIEGVLLWRRQLPTKGLLNVVSAPHLQVESTSHAVWVTSTKESYRSTTTYTAALHAAKHAAHVAALAAANGGELPDDDDGDDDEEGEYEVEEEEEDFLHTISEIANMEDDRLGAHTHRAGHIRSTHFDGAGQGEYADYEPSPDNNNNNNNDDNDNAGLLEIEHEDEEEDTEEEEDSSAGLIKRSLLQTEGLPAGDPLLPYPPTIGGYWASGYPHLDNDSKDRQHGLSSGAQLPLFWWDSSGLKEYLLGLPPADWEEETQSKNNAFLSGRASNVHQFKPGTFSMHLIFSDQAGTEVFEFPWYKERFAKFLDPLIKEILGIDVVNIIRLQFALMPGGTHIKRHVDKGGYSSTGHRIHLVVASSSKVSFQVCEAQTCVPLHVEEGLVFELNNRLDHFVDNDGEESRIHMVLDVSEEPKTRMTLKKGQVCHYDGGRIVCPPV